MEKSKWKLAKRNDIVNATKFLYKMRNQTNPPFSTYPGGVKKTVESCFSSGKLLLAYCNNKIVGLLGYFNGVPRLDSKGEFKFTNHNIGYIYILVIAPEHRGFLSFSVLSSVAKFMIEDGHNEIRFKAYNRKTNLLNRLYSRYGKIIATEKNIQGEECNLFSAQPKNWLK